MTNLKQIIWLLILGFGERLIQKFKPDFEFEIPEDYE